jgi:hypothetical protein
MLKKQTILWLLKAKEPVGKTMEIGPLTTVTVYK